MDGLIIVTQVALALAYGAIAWTDRQRPAADNAAPGTLVMRWALALAIVVHGAVLWRLAFQVEGINLSFAVSLSIIGLLLALWIWVAGILMPVPGMALRTLPIVAADVLLPALLPTPHWLPYSTDAIATAHLVVALLAFALFVIAAVQAAAMLALQQDLRRGLSSGAGSAPPILTLERWLFGMIGVGFLLLTATLASGVLFSEALFGRPVQFNHKTLFSGLAWVLFGVLLVGRWRWGWRGRKALRWIVTGSLLLLIGYAGSKFVFEVVLGRV